MSERPDAPAATGVLRVTLDLPDYHVDPADTDEDIEVSMNLASDQVGVIFYAHDGDDPQARPHTLIGSVVKIEVARG